MWTNKKKYNKIILIQGGFMNKELLKHAQEYIEKMAQGINPITGEVVPEDDTLNNIKITRCLYYVNDVLKEVIAKGIKGNKNKGIPFNLTIDELNNYEFTEELPLSKIVKKINDLKNNLDMNDLKLKDVYEWLIDIGLLEIVKINNKNCKRPTELGKDMGIRLKHVYNNYESYDIVIFNIEIQKFIIDNFNSLYEYI